MNSNEVYTILGFFGKFNYLLFLTCKLVSYMPIEGIYDRFYEIIFNFLLM